MRPVRRAVSAVALGLCLMLVPDAQVAPTAISLVAVEHTTAVDFGDGIVVVLALGSDSRTPDPLEGNADAIELIAVDFETGQAAAVGIPRDTLVDIDGHGPAKINAGLLLGGPDLMAAEVAQLTGITPQYVVTTGFAGFQDLVESAGELRVQSDVDLSDSDYQLDVHPGTNDLNGLQATGFARSRDLPGDDFTRMANQQHLLQAILARIRSREDEEGFMEAGAIAALRNLETNLSPRELYRFAQAISQVDPAQATTCVLTGPTEDLAGLGNVVHLDPSRAERAAADAADNGHLEGAC